MHQTEQQIEEHRSSPGEKCFNPSEFIKEIMKQLAAQSNVAKAAMASELGDYSEHNVILNGSEYEIVHKSGKPSPAEAGEELLIASETAVLIVRAACIPTVVFYPNTGLPNGLPYLSYRDNKRAEFNARRMRQQMFEPPASIPGE